MQAGNTNVGTISGIVYDSTHYSLSNVNIVIFLTTWGTTSDKFGKYRLENVPQGSYSVKFSSMGYEQVIESNVVVTAGRETRLDVVLLEKVLPMQEVVVTPSNFSIAQSRPAKQQSIEKEKIAAIPATLDDIYRVIQVMPGVAFSDDFSAHFHVRGGKQSENLILLDGMELHDPYHLKNIGGAVGIMNMDMIDNISIMTGGFGAKYGDRLSSVISIENRAGRVDRFRGNIGAGGTGLSMLFESPIPFGSFAASFRKSFLKEAVEILNPTDYAFSPSFYDVQSKISLQANENNQIAVNLLYAKDDSYLERWKMDSQLHSDYGNSYQGLVWKSIINPKLFSELVLSRGENFWDNRIGDAKREKLNFTENAVGWNVNVQPHENHNIEFGLTYKLIRYKYEAEVEEVSLEQQDLEHVISSYLGSQKISPQTHKLAFYVQDTFKLFKSFYTNIGLRYDYLDYNDDQQVSPRVSFSYHTKQKYIFRAAWGRFCQAPAYTALSNSKGVEHNPQSEKSTHYVLGIEKYFNEHFSVRVESYYKTLERMIGHYFEIDQQSGQPELKYGNPNSGVCKGIEFFVNGKVSKDISVWATCAFSKAEIEAMFVNWNELRLEAKMIPRFTDQPHNFSLFLNYRMSKSWELNLKWRYLSGIPHTPRYPAYSGAEPYWAFGEPYSARYPAYHRLDIRIGKRFFFTNWQLSSFLEIKNLYNRKNVLIYDYQINDGSHFRNAYHTLPFLPTIEFKISF